MKKPLRLIRNISKVFFPAFAIGIVYCFIEMWASNRPFMSFGLMLICIGMALACANVEVWAKSKLTGTVNEEALEDSEMKEAS